MTARDAPRGIEPREALDHLVFACPDLDDGVALVEGLLGVTASPGGRHEGLGTRNALIGLGARSYLEIVSVDPDQPAPDAPRWFGIDELEEPRLVTWAVKSRGLDRAVAAAAAVGVDVGEPTAAGRRLPDGQWLSWTFTDPRADRLDGVVPFFVDWGDSSHPAASLPPACALVGLRAEHPDAGRVTSVLRALDLDLSVSEGARPRLIASLRTPSGSVELG